MSSKNLLVANTLLLIEPHPKMSQLLLQIKKCNIYFLSIPNFNNVIDKAKYIAIYTLKIPTLGTITKS